VEAEREYAEFIDPREQDVEGVVRGFSEAPTKFGDAIVIELELGDGGRRALWLTSTVLKNKIARLKPKIDERLEVSFLGQRDGANGSYNDFAVSCPDRPAYEPDWDKLADEPEAEERWGA
jgi:hypothetical protein